MKKLLIFVAVLISITSCAQVRISDMPTFTGNPNGGYVPEIISGVNRKVDPVYFGFNKIDSIKYVGGVLYYYSSGGSANAVGGSGSVPTLNAVTTAGNSSTNSMNVNNSSGGYHAVTMGYDNYSGQVQFTNNIFNRSVLVGSRYADSNYTVDFPKIHISPFTRITVPMFVNGVASDSLGNINIGAAAVGNADSLGHVAAINYVTVNTTQTVTGTKTFNAFTTLSGIANQATTDNVYYVSFPDGVANQAVKIELGNFNLFGSLTVEVAGAYSTLNSSGKITKVIGIGYTSGNNIFTNESRISESVGLTSANIAIGDVQWDAGLTQYVIPVYHIASGGGAFTIRVKSFLYSNAEAASLLAATTLSSVYTLTSIAQQSIYFNNKFGYSTNLSFNIADSQKVPTKYYVDGLSVDTVANITSLQAYNRIPNLNRLFVADTLQGGLFFKTTSGVANGGTVFAAAGGGFWNRKMDNQFMINVLYFGARGLGADDLPSIKLAIAYANTLSTGASSPAATLFFPNVQQYYYVTDSLPQINTNINVIMDGYLRYNHPANLETVMTIGKNGFPNDNVHAQIKIYNQNTSDWQSNLTVGVKFINALYSNIQIDQVQGFTIGAMFTGNNTGGSAAGFAYNKIDLYNMNDNKFGVYCLAGGTTGYVNENIFNNGGFSFPLTSTAKWDSIPRYGFWLDGTINEVNNNLFVKPSFELANNILTNGATGIGFLMVTAVQNHVIQARFEGGNPSDITGAFHYTIAKETNFSGANTYDVGSTSNVAIIDNNGTTDKSSSIRTQFDRNRDPFIKHVWSSGNLSKVIAPYNSTLYNIANVGLFDYTANGYTLTNTIRKAVVTPYKDFLTFSPTSGVGVFVNTSQVKKFLLNKDYKAGSVNSSTMGTGIVYVFPYDSTGTALVGGGAKQYVFGDNLSSVTWDVSSGSYIFADQYSANQFIALDTFVYSVKIIWVANHNTQIIGFGIDQLDPGTASVWTGIQEPIRGDNVAQVMPPATNPAGNAWLDGYTVVNSVKGAGQPYGWYWDAVGSAWNLFGMQGDTFHIYTDKYLKAKNDTLFKTKTIYTIASAATHTLNSDSEAVYIVTAQASSCTFANIAGRTPNESDVFEIVVHDNGTAQAITWGTVWTATTQFALPTTTGVGQKMRLYYEWDAIAAKMYLINKITY